MQVSDFIVQCVERAGGMVDARGANVMDALLTPPLDEKCGGKSLLTLALDADALAVEPQAELATIGSPLMDALIAFASERGTTSAGHVVVERLKKKGLREEVERAIIFSNCRIRYDDGEPDVFLCAYAQFNFKVTFFSDERRERFYVVPINLWSNQANPPLAERLPALTIAAEPTGNFLNARRAPIEKAYETARRALRELVNDEIAQHQARVKRRFVVEFSRISDYYAQVTQELQRRREREDDAQKAQALSQKMEAAQLERERKLRELSETYRLRPRAQLTSARLLWQPKTFFKLFVDRGQTTRPLTLAYDSVLERLEPPVCESCRRETTRVHVSASAQFLCPSCAEWK